VCTAQKTLSTSVTQNQSFNAAQGKNPYRTLKMQCEHHVEILNAKVSDMKQLLGCKRINDAFTMKTSTYSPERTQ